MANNFIDNGLVSSTGLALPGTKSDVAGAPSIPTQNAWRAAEGNAVLGGLADIKTVIDRQVSIMSYGADPTGAGDNYIAIGSALSALSSGGTLHFPPGTYALKT